MIVEIDHNADTTATTDPPKKRGGGPRSPEGREASRRNATKHSMRAKVLLPEDLVEAIERRKVEFFRQFQPTNPFEEYLVTEIAVASTWLDRCQEMKIGDINRRIDRAVLCWDKDRRGLVEIAALKLPKEPSRVAQALEGTLQGADWKILRWTGLAKIARTRGTWDEAQRSLAFDMLGVPHEMREESDLVPKDGDAEALAALAEGEVARLQVEQDEVLEELDESDREMATAGSGDEDATSARYRRCEASNRRALSWAMAQLEKGRRASKAKVGAKSGEPLSAVPPLTGASLNYMAERSRAMTPEKMVEADERIAEREAAEAAEEAAWEAADEAQFAAIRAAETATHDEEPVPATVSRPVGVVPPAPRAIPRATAASKSFGPSPELNRRERRAEKARARKAAR